MRLSSFGFVFLTCLSGMTLNGATVIDRPMTAGAATVLAIDDVACGRVLSWEGGDLRSNAVSEARPGGGLPAKHASAPACAPLVLQVSFPPPAALSSWINELCGNNPGRRKLTLTSFNAGGAATEAFEAVNATLTEVHFPGLDAASVAVGPLELIFRVEQSRAVAPTAIGAGRVLAATSVRTFALGIDGVDGTGVIKIEPFTIIQRPGADPAGLARAGTGTTEFSNLRVTLSAAKAATWRTWWTNFIVNGRNADADEKRGAITFVGANMRPLDLALNFEQMGILRLSRVPADADGAVRNEAELYFERLSWAAKPEPIAQPASTDPTRNPADQGSRDPAAFPRAEGLTRVYYSGTFQPGYTNEQAGYTSASKLYELLARVDEAAKKDGWSMTTLSETEDPAAKTVNESWVKPPASATLSFIEPKTDGPTKFDLQVYVTIPAEK